jgi:hypothetical protein
MCVLPLPRMPVMSTLLCDSQEVPALAAAADFLSGNLRGTEWASRLILNRCSRSIQNSGYVLSTHSLSVTTMPGTRTPSTAKLMAMRWSL